MYRIAEIQDKLQQVVGWDQAFAPSLAIDPALTRSESGLYFQGAHPYLTLRNIASVMPDNFYMLYPAWQGGEVYAAGRKCRTANNHIWVASRENVDTPPPSDFNGDYTQVLAGPWQPYNMLSDYIARMTRAGIASVVQTFTTMKGLQQQTRNLFERRAFFDGAGRMAATIDNGPRLVGFEIVPLRAMGVTAKIERIGLQMIGGAGTVRLYLFHSSQVAPLRTFDLEIAGNGSFQWFDVADCYLPYMGAETNAGGAWYLCYNQAALPAGVQAINFSKDWSREPCGSCNKGNLQTWRDMTKYMQVSPFATRALETFEQYPEMWDIARNTYTNTTNYGLNVEVTVGCDLTDFIIQQRAIFQDVIQKQVAANILREIALNPDNRVNRNQVNVARSDVLYELDGNTASPRPGGLGYALRKAYEALNISTEGIDRACLTCNNHGVRYGSV